MTLIHISIFNLSFDGKFVEAEIIDKFPGKEVPGYMVEIPYTLHRQTISQDLSIPE